MSTFEANPVSLQTFSISTLASYATAFEAFSLSEEEATLIAKLKEIFETRGTVRIRTNVEEYTRTYEILHNSVKINDLKELKEMILSKCLDAEVYLDNHLFKVAFSISGREVAVIPGRPGPRGIQGDPENDGVTYEEIKQKLIEEGYIPATFGLKTAELALVNHTLQQSGVPAETTMLSESKITAGNVTEIKQKVLTIKCRQNSIQVIPIQSIRDAQKIVLSKDGELFEILILKHPTDFTDITLEFDDLKTAQRVLQKLLRVAFDSKMIS